MDIIFQCLIQNKTKMGGFGAITISVFSFVIMRLNGIVKVGLGILDALADFWNIRQLQGCPIGLYYLHQVNPVKIEIVVQNLKFPGWKIEGLFYQINILIHYWLLDQFEIFASPKFTLKNDKSNAPRKKLQFKEELLSIKSVSEYADPTWSIHLLEVSLPTKISSDYRSLFSVPV